MPTSPMRQLRRCCRWWWISWPNGTGRANRGAVVMGMGSLGARRLNAASDVDLLVIYDAAGVEDPLAANRWRRARGMRG